MTSSRSKVLSSTDVVVNQAPVRVGDSHAQSSTASNGSSDDHSHEPEVSVEHDATGNVARIHVRCRCGEDITIACDYPNAA